MVFLFFSVFFLLLVLLFPWRPIDGHDLVFVLFFFGHPVLHFLLKSNPPTTLNLHSDSSIRLVVSSLFSFLFYVSISTLAVHFFRMVFSFFVLFHVGIQFRRVFFVGSLSVVRFYRVFTEFFFLKQSWWQWVKKVEMVVLHWNRMKVSVLPGFT